MISNVISLKTTNIISIINNEKNIVEIVSITFSLSGLPMIFSTIKNIKCPPSSAGIGKIIAIASLEPIEFYKKIPYVKHIIKNFYEFDRSIFLKK